MAKKADFDGPEEDKIQISVFFSLTCMIPPIKTLPHAVAALTSQ